jgi:hypothetical protein
MSCKQGKYSAVNGRKGGRPKSSATLRAQIFREELSKRIEKKSEEYLTAIEDLALGHYVETKSTNGLQRVYKKSPDIRAWREVVDRAFGKVAIAIETKTDEDEQIQMTLNGIQEIISEGKTCNQKQ